MAKNVHIEHIGDTEANVRANMDLYQVAILSDQNEEFVWYNSDASKMYYAAAQKYWNGAAITYCNVDFGQVTLHDDLLVDEYIKRSGGTDDLIRFENDKISIAAGGATAMVFEDDRIYSGLKLFAFGKTTPESWDSDFIGCHVGGMGVIYSDSGEGVDRRIGLGLNYYDDGDHKRIVNDEVSIFLQRYGSFYWYGDAAGTADVAFTPTLRMLLASADLSTASVQLGLGTSTPLLNVGSATGDFTGDGMHIKSDVANDRQAFVIIEGDSYHPNGGAHGSGGIIFADNGGDADDKMISITLNEGGTGAQDLTIKSLDDDVTGKNNIMKLDGNNQYITHYHGTNDVVWEDAVEGAWAETGDWAGHILINVNNTDYWVPFETVPV